MKNEAKILGAALSELRKGESLERAIGRIVRRFGGSYRDYVRVMDTVRDLADRERLTTMQAAQKLAHP